MKLSPLDIYNKEFKKSTFGYNVNQVNDFLDDVGMAYERLLKEVNSLKDENERLRERLSGYENMEEKMEKVMLTLQETAREQTRQAKKEADLIIQRAEIKAEKVERAVKKEIEEEYSSLQELRESRNLFKIRFKTLLQSHLEMLEEEELDLHQVEEDIAAGKLTLDE